MHKITDLISIFNDTFYQSHQTRLVKGDDEPIYLPQDEEYHYHRIVFANGFYSSGLHEIAHWLIAGEKRRKIIDYGYWYCPDGRTKDQQIEFESVEIKPQAVEWALAVASGANFNVSSDNLNGEQTCRIRFQEKVHQQVLSFINYGFNPRTQVLLKALSDFYKTPWPINKTQFNW